MKLTACLTFFCRLSMAQTTFESFTNEFTDDIIDTPTLRPFVVPSPTMSPSPTDFSTVTISAPPSISNLPSTAPSSSMMPTATTHPSSAPFPSPTAVPTISSQPSISTRPSETPSYSPSQLPSFHPTLLDANIVTATYEQRLLVTTTEVFTEEEISLFQYLYERYTSSFGYFMSKPQIVTTSTVLKQTISNDPENVTVFQSTNGFRHRRDVEFAYVLSVSFTIEYQSKIEIYDISNYNTLFKDYVNENTTKVAQDMELIGLPVVGVSMVIMFTAPDPTSEPTQKPTISHEPTSSPTFTPSELPSNAPSKDKSIEVASTSFVLGISLGIVGACIIVLLGYMYRLHLGKSDDHFLFGKSRRGIEEDSGGRIEITDLPNVTNQNIDEKSKQIETVSANTNTMDIESAVRLTDASELQHSVKNQINRPQLLSPQSTSSYEHFLAEGLSIGGTKRGPEMFPDGVHQTMIHDASFSSSDGSFNDEVQQADSFNETFHPSIFDGSTDELDNYKNQRIETLRTAVEDAVYDVEGMMMLAVTNALTQFPSASDDEQDYSALEAENLYQAYDWWKRNEYSRVDSKREYFQELLNRIVNLVFFESIPPMQGYQIIHGCATIIGLPLVHILPQTTLIIQGMLKTNSLVLGQQCINRAFKSFGDIQAAAIAPDNHGFGFVRFVDAQSAQNALNKYRDSEIVIQDVAVSVKVLKSEGLL